MRQASPFRTIIIVALVALLFVVVFKLFGGGSNKSDVDKLVNTLQKTKPSTNGGILPSTPIEAIKQIEKFASTQGIKDTKIDYRLAINFGDSKEAYNVVANVASDPFRWRIDFSDAKASFQSIFINDSKAYYNCNLYDKKCDKFSSLDELSLPIPLTDFLNAVLDPIQLKKFVGKTPETSTKTIAAKSANCMKASEDYEVVEICTDKEGGTPLLIFVKRQLAEYSLEATKVDNSTLSANTFSPPYQIGM